MSVRRERIRCPKTGKERFYWRVDIVYEHPDGSSQRVRKNSPVNTRKGAEQYERQLRQQLLEGTYKKQRKEEEPDAKERRVPTLKTFSAEFIRVYAKTNNKPSEVQSKESILKQHLMPAFGRMRLDQVGPRDIERYKSGKLADGLSPKTVNNTLTVLRRMLSLAVEWEVIKTVPPFSWLRVPPQKYDFLDFEEAERLVRGADEESRPMILLAVRTGMRLGELIALRWEDVDLEKGQLRVCRAAARGIVGTPKNGRTREVPLGKKTVLALRGARHLKGELVFCQADGRLLSKDQCNEIIWRTCRRAKLRRIGWHVLRHTFASHLVMRGVPLLVVQELLGHQTIQMTQRYSHLTPDVRRDAVELLEPENSSRPNRGQNAEPGGPASSSHRKTIKKPGA